jgi:hypothetical protein
MPRTRRVQDKDVIARLADAGEEALQRLAELPGGKAVLETMNGVRDRLDDVATRLRALDPLERRVSAIEKRLDSLQSPRKTTARRKTTRAKTPSARRMSTRTKRPSS